MILPKQIGEKVTELGEMGILMNWQAYDMILTLGIHIMIFQGGNTSWERLRDLSKVRKEPRFKPKFTWLQVCSLSTCEHNGLRKRYLGPACLDSKLHTAIYEPHDFGCIFNPHASGFHRKLLWGLKELTCAEYLEQCLMQSKCCINVS